MPDEQAHLAQARHNADFAKSLVDNSDGPHDWAVTVTFYAALHFLEGWLIQQNIDVVAEARRNHVSPHRFRSDQAKKLLPKEMAVIYTKLQRHSQLARYLTTNLTNKGNYGPESSLPSPPAEYYKKGAAETLYGNLSELKAHLGY